MQRAAFDKLKTMKLWHLLWISLVLSEVLTAIMDVCMGLLWWGRIDRELMIIGSIDAFVVASIVSVILILLFREIRNYERRTQETVRRAREEWERTFNSMSDLIMILDTNHRVVRVNTAMAEKLKMTPSEAEGITCYEHVHGLKEPPSFCPHSMLMADGREHFAEGYEEGLGGFYLVSVTPLLNAGGTVTGSVHTAKDISERVRAEQALRESEEKFRTLFESATDAIFILDMEGNLIEINQTAHERLGYSKDELLAMPLSELDTPEFARSVPARMEQMREHGKAVFESAHRRKDGTVMPVEINTRVIDFEGKKAILSIIRDISARKRREKALKDNERFLRTVIETEPECIKLLASDGALMQMNSAGLSIIEADSFEQVKGRCIYEFVVPEHREAFQALTENVFKGRPGKLEFEATGLKNRHVWLDTNAVPLRNDMEEIIALLGITRDITERKHAEIALSKAAEEKDDLIRRLQQALVTIKTLQGILPICASCKKIRDDEGDWHQIESYIRDHSEAEFSHSFCPECVKKLYPDIR